MKIVKTKFAKIMAASMLASAGVLIPVQGPIAAVSGTTAVAVQAPNIIILHYYNTLTLTFSDLNEAVDEGTATPAAQALAATVTFAGGMTAAGLSNSTYEGLGGTMAVTVTDAWAVRAIASAGANINVTGVLDTANATLNTSTISLSNLQVASGGACVAAATGVTFTPPGMAKASARMGDVCFDMDISSATEAGLHTGAQYTLTATSI
mgnify:CR=1 FL=1